MTQAQIDAAYNQFLSLKTTITNVDTKYSLTYHEPELDLPSTLGLTALTYTAKTDAQLSQSAVTATEAWNTSETAKINSSYNSGVAKQTQIASDALASYNLQVSNINNEKQQAIETAKNEVIDNGCAFGSVLTDVVAKVNSKYSAKLTEAQTKYNNTVASCNSVKATLLTTKTTSLANLATERTAKQNAIVAELREKDDKLGTSVAKYNQTLAEKETKYQASCKKALEYAREAEYDRALRASELYAELGESGLEQQKLSEKLSLAKAFFSTLPRSVAQQIMTSDGFLSAQLGTYYSSLQTFVNGLSEY